MSILSKEVGLVEASNAEGEFREPFEGGSEMPDATGELREHIERLWRRHWLLALAGIAMALHAYPVYRLFATLPANRFPPHSHTIIFEYVGWFLSVGGRLYVDIWALKPPLAHLVPMTVAGLTGGTFVYHYALVGLTALAAAGSVVAVALVGYRLTGSRGAAIAGAAVPLTDPNFVWRPTLGFEPKYYVLVFGLLGLSYLLADRPFRAGIASAVAAGMWQLAAVFPLIVLVEFARRRGGTPRRALAGMGAVGLVGLLPVLYWGALPAMLSEVLLTPLLVSNEGTNGLLYGFSLLHNRVTRYLVWGGLAGFLLVVVRLLWDRTLDRWWAPALGGWFLIQFVVIDADGFPDTFVFLGVAGIGLAILVAELPSEPPTAGVTFERIVAVGLLLVAVWTLLQGWGFASYYFAGRTARAQTLVPPPNPGEFEYAFWATKRVEVCRFFGGEMQRSVVERFGGSMHAERCGRYFWPMLRALLG